MNAKPSYPQIPWEDVSWQAKAACHPRADTAIDPEAFFAVKKDDKRTQQAKRVCRHCPALKDCLRFALTHNLVGVWGGTTDRERADLRRRWAA